MGRDLTDAHRRASLEVHGLVKRYGDVVAVDDLSFTVFEGEIFGLLGPNGAGKTTTIRIAMDIFKPDRGQVSVLGHPPGVAQDRVGYLPEERGLYPDLKALELLVYLAELKGLSRARARENSLVWLERVGLAEWATHKVKALSRGMQQKLQFVASLVHDPELLILDEPFQGLDPVNVELLKGLIRALQAEGRTIVLSAHQMNLVEALCDRIVLINRGRAVLYGRLDEIKRRYASRSVRLRTPAVVGDLPGVVDVRRRDGMLTLTLGDITPQELLRVLVDRGIPIESFEVASMPLEEIFINVVRGEEHA
ncbi:MAG: ATP-binding cassette domain-containing protein [Anaerolineae bacterium]|nr:ATP-binding cassette domain-containing protein [Anaerolineae bacterium]